VIAAPRITKWAHYARFERRIEYRGVAFSYNGQAPVLECVDFEVQRGQVVAVVGPSGAGKTTLVDLLPRFYEPTRGDILMDGVPISQFTRTSLRGLMGIVSQETILLNDTVLANISYGRSDFTLAQVQAAARAANAHDFVSQLPDGYQTLLGERGTRLSGGERQRIVLRRPHRPLEIEIHRATVIIRNEGRVLQQQIVKAGAFERPRQIEAEVRLKPVFRLAAPRLIPAVNPESITQKPTKMERRCRHALLLKSTFAGATALPGLTQQASCHSRMIIRARSYAELSA